MPWSGGKSHVDLFLQQLAASPSRREEAQSKELPTRVTSSALGCWEVTLGSVPIWQQTATLPEEEVPV